MNIERGVCNKDLAKQLKKLGVKQDSYWFWWAWHNDERIDLIPKDKDIGFGGGKLWSAPTPSELGEILPEYVEKDDETYALRIWKNGEKWEVVYTYHRLGIWNMLHITRAYTLADAMGMMVEYLLKNKLMEA